MLTQTLQQRANAVARQNGHGRATQVTIGTEGKIISSIPFGYRKYTTGQYVPNAYRAKFGWKNTYYQQAECHVQVKS